MNISLNAVKPWFWKLALFGLVVGVLVPLGLLHEIRVHPHTTLAELRFAGVEFPSLLGIGIAFWVLLFVVGKRLGGYSFSFSFGTFIWQVVPGEKPWLYADRQYPDGPATADDAFAKKDEEIENKLHQDYFVRQAPKPGAADLSHWAERRSAKV
jgi:hypothetical protein